MLQRRAHCARDSFIARVSPPATRRVPRNVDNLRCILKPEHDVSDMMLTPCEDHPQQLLGIGRCRSNYGRNQFTSPDVCTCLIRDIDELVKTSVDWERPADRSGFRRGSRR
ncbi:hypothetical protein I546_4967 [Mycobacterium kansasii 732]|nr:hypothetical protein I546_4967 [Mycobacterium kansasii 732]